MTEPSQYFKGRTVQEQMNEVIGYVDVRSAEVATDAIAADVAQVHQDMLDADADAAAAAASAAAAAGTLANAVKKTGEASQSIAGDIAVAGDLTGGTVTVPAPVNNTDAASKKYVDDHDALLIPIARVNTYAVGLTGNQTFSGNKINYGEFSRKDTVIDKTDISPANREMSNVFYDKNDQALCVEKFTVNSTNFTRRWDIRRSINGHNIECSLIFSLSKTGTTDLSIKDANGNYHSLGSFAYTGDLS